MGSRFTEYFDINEPWELSISESSPLTRSSTLLYFSSTETLNIDYNYSSVDDRNADQSHKSNKTPSLIHSYSSALSNQSESTEPKKLPIPSKLKRFLSTISTKRSPRCKSQYF